MTVAEPLTEERRDAFARVRAAAAVLRMAAQSADAERDVLERDVEVGAIDVGSVEYLERADAAADLERQVDDRRAELAGALDELGGFEVLALSGRSPDEARQAVARAERRLAGELDPDDRLGWVAVARAAELVAAGVDPSAYSWSSEQADPDEALDATGMGPAEDGAAPTGAAAFAPDPAEPPTARAAAPGASARRRPRRLRPPTVRELVTAAIITAVAVAGFAVLGGRSTGPARPVAAKAVPARPGTSPIPAVDITHQAEACTNLANDALGKLAPKGVSSGVALDPHRFIQAPYIGVGFAGTLGTFGGPDSRAPYEVIGALYPPGVTTSPLGTPIDRLGAVQMWFGFDGTTSYKGLRRLVDGHWSMAIDQAANAMTVDAGPTSTLFFYPAIRPGWRFSMVVASAAGCKVLSSRAGGPGPVSLKASVRASGPQVAWPA